MMKVNDHELDYFIVFIFFMLLFCFNIKCGTHFYCYTKKYILHVNVKRKYNQCMIFFLNINLYLFVYLIFNYFIKLTFN